MVNKASLTGTRPNKLCGSFIVSAGVLLALTGAAKILSALGKSPVLAKPDPIFGIHFNYLLLSVGLIELVVTVLCTGVVNPNVALRLIMALSLNFLGYRIGLWLIHWHGYCPCLGTLTEAIHLSRRSADILTLGILAYLLIGSFYFLARFWWSPQTTTGIGGSTLATSKSSSYAA